MHDNNGSRSGAQHGLPAMADAAGQTRIDPIGQPRRQRRVDHRVCRTPGAPVDRQLALSEAPPTREWCTGPGGIGNP